MQTADTNQDQQNCNGEQYQLGVSAEHPSESLATIETLSDLASLVDYSFMDSLTADPEAELNGDNRSPREVRSGHYVQVKPEPIQNPEYISHSAALFRQLGFADSLAQSAEFIQLFSADLSDVPAPMRKLGWATGYALSIYGNEYTQQCPFRTGNGYGDGRAASVLEVLIKGQRLEMQLKGSGRTPYSRGADGRAVLRSSVREFLAQEHMHALGVPTARSLCLYASTSETVQRPWYSEGSRAQDPDRMVSNAVAISTRVAPSFIRVGQLELFARRARSQAHPQAMQELEQIVLHLIEREYAGAIDKHQPIEEQVLALAREFRRRLTSLVANWIRVGFCQGNFNSDNCAAGGFTLDYGPYGFCDVFDPRFQPWTGGGQHYSFLNQPVAAGHNFASFCSALRPLLASCPEALLQLDQIQRDFPEVMQLQMQQMWAAKLGLKSFDAELFNELLALMLETAVDYTIFFRELSAIPDDITPLKKSFYTNAEALHERWLAWLVKWKAQISQTDAAPLEQISQQMKRANPKYILREWFVVPAYQAAANRDYGLTRQLQEILTKPYAEQSAQVEREYFRLKPPEYFKLGGTSHYSCSS